MGALVPATIQDLMELVVPAIAALVAALAAASIATVLARSRARRQLAEERVQTAADLAAARQDNKWLTRSSV